MLYLNTCIRYPLGVYLSSIVAFLMLKKRLSLAIRKIMKLTHETAGFFKITWLFAPKGKTCHKDAKNMQHIKGENPPESIAASFLKISWLEPEIFQVKEWFQVKVSIPVASGPYV